MAVAAVDEYLKLLPSVKKSPEGYLWLLYDEEADVLYVDFKKPSRATDSDLTDHDLIVRYEGKEIVGRTVLHTRQRP